MNKRAVTDVYTVMERKKERKKECKKECKKSWIKLTVAGIASAVLLSNCVTSYDQYGRPIQTADPAAVAIGAVALGAIAYSAGKSDGDYHGGRHHRSRGHGHHGGHGYRGCR